MNRPNILSSHRFQSPPRAVSNLVKTVPRDGCNGCLARYEIGDGSAFGLRYWSSGHPFVPVAELSLASGDLEPKTSFREAAVAGVSTLGLVTLSFAAVYWLHAQWITGLAGLASSLAAP